VLCQALLNVFTVLGLAPLTGVPLPFISSGSSSLLVLLASMGLVLNVAGGGSSIVRAVPASGRDAQVAIAAGGTAGHVVPALAVASALRADGHEVVFLGGERAEAELVPAAGFELRTIQVRGLSRTNPFAAAGAGALAARGTAAAARILRELGADVVMGGGGYVAGPVGLAAVSLRIPLVLTEADSHVGMANRLLAPFARRVCLAFPISGRDGDKYLVTGRPVPAPATDRAAARQRFGLGEDERCVLLFGGSLGARTINQAAVEAFAADPGYRVLHAAGRRDFDALAPRVAGLPTTPSSPTSTASARRCWPATSAWPGPAGRSSRSPPRGARRSSCPIRTPPPTTRPATPGGCRTAARRSSSPTAS
jgi:hypothetical protein